MKSNFRLVLSILLVVLLTLPVSSSTSYGGRDNAGGSSAKEQASQAESWKRVGLVLGILSASSYLFLKTDQAPRELLRVGGRVPVNSPLVDNTTQPDLGGFLDKHWKSNTDADSQSDAATPSESETPDSVRTTPTAALDLPPEESPYGTPSPNGTGSVSELNNCHRMFHVDDTCKVDSLDPNFNSERDPVSEKAPLRDKWEKNFCFLSVLEFLRGQKEDYHVELIQETVASDDDEGFRSAMSAAYFVMSLKFGSSWSCTPPPSKSINRCPKCVMVYTKSSLACYPLSGNCAECCFPSVYK